MSEKIGIIGGGVAGLVSAYLLKDKYDVEVLEARDYAGGHTNTEDVRRADGEYHVNTGFIVFNLQNYPNFLKFIGALGVEYQPAPMSFSVKCMRTGLEYGFETYDAIFAQRQNIFSFPFLRMLWEISRFRKKFDDLLADPRSAELSVGEYLTSCGYSRMFIDQFIMPFGGAIWSADYDKMSAFPLRTFVQFFKNHGFLAESELLQWYTLKGGSRSYVTALMKLMGDRICLDSRVIRVRRESGGINVSIDGQADRVYDRVVIAAHSDQALEMLENPTQDERSVLGDIGYQPNDVVLHTDINLMPLHRQTWSSWNYCVPAGKADMCTVTYDMNILQSIESSEEFLVTLNQSADVAEDATIKSFVYSHPVFNSEAIAAQGRYGDINGKDRIYYAGAYWGYGFHEDGVNSALAACSAIDDTLKL